MQKKHLIGAGITAFSVILGLLWLIPLIWLIGTAFSVPSFHMTLFPTTAFTLDNIKYVWNAIPFGTYYINTLTLVVCTFAVQFFTSTLAAYALAVLDFKGQALVFAVIFMQIGFSLSFFMTSGMILVPASLSPFFTVVLPCVRTDPS